MLTAHPAVIAAGPGTIHRLCCGTGEAVDTELATEALEAIDDPVALVDEQPVTVAALWRTVLGSLGCPDRKSAPQSVLVVYPSWWSGARVDLVTAAAGALAGDVVTRPRWEVLADAAGWAPDTATKVVVEIAARLVAITVTNNFDTVAEPRSGAPYLVAELVARRAAIAAGDAAAVVLIDAPDGVDGAAELAAEIDDRVRATLADASTELIGDSGLGLLAAAASPPGADPARPKRATARGLRPHRVPALLVAMGVFVLLGIAAVGSGKKSSHDASVAEVAPTTFLVEGRVTLQVPAQWPIQRVTAGPGSARVQVVSPSDPQVVLHVTQSPVPDRTLAATGESLQRALTQANEREPAGVFVDFDQSGQVAGRPAVTYREVRDGHDIAWTVLLDGTVRISVGCQHRLGGAGAVRQVCEQAVRSAHVLR